MRDLTNAASVEINGAGATIYSGSRLTVLPSGSILVTRPGYAMEYRPDGTAQFHRSIADPR